MSRIKDFMKFDDGQFDDVDNILSQSGKTCDVYRASYSGTPGFGNEVEGESRVKRIIVHIARKSGIERTNVEGGIKSNKVNFVGLTNDDDVRIGDIWLIESKRYRVYDVDIGSKGKTEVNLELQV